MGLVFLQQPQQVVDFLVFQRENGRGDERLQRGLGDTGGYVKVLLVDDAHDVVDALTVNQQTGELGFGEDLGNLLLGGVQGDGLNIHPVGEDIFHLQVVELNGVAQKLSFVQVDAAVLLDLLHQEDQLFGRHFVVLFHLQNLGQQLFPGGEQEVHRGQDHTQDIDDGGGEHGEFLRAVLGDALGGNFAEDQHHYGDDHGGEGGAYVAAYTDEKHRGDGRKGDIDDVVSDEDGGQQFVIILGKLVCQPCPFAALFRQGFQPGFVGGGKGGLRGGKIRRQQHQNDNGDYVWQMI